MNEKPCMLACINIGYKQKWVRKMRLRGCLDAPEDVFPKTFSGSTSLSVNQTHRQRSRANDDYKPLPGALQPNAQIKGTILLRLYLKMMDVGNGSEQTASFLAGELSTSSVELNKKRKLQHDPEHFALPLSKHKFRDRFGSSGTEEERKQMRNSLKEMIIRGIRDHSDDLGETDSDSNSINQDTTMTLNLDDAEKRPGMDITQDLPSTSNSSTNSLFGSTVNSYHFPNMDETINNEGDDPGEVQKLKPKHIKQLQQQHGFEGFGNCTISEIGKNGTDLLDIKDEDAFLYSNDIAPHAFLLSPEMWNNGQGSTMAKKPTIDQEFEEYFSELML